MNRQVPTIAKGLFARAQTPFLLVALVVGVTCSPSGNDKKDLKLIEDMTSVQLCSSSSDKKFEDVFASFNGAGREEPWSSLDYQQRRDFVVRHFDTADNRCLSLSNSDASLSSVTRRRTHRQFGFVNLQGRIVPVAVSWRDDANFEDKSNIGPIIIRVPGGPGGVDIFPSSDFTTPLFGDAAVIDLFYTGHGFNILHPKPSFQIAADQLSLMLERVRARNPRAEIILMGESLGAVISLAALDKLSAKDGNARTPVDKLVLLSPPFGSLQDTASKLREMSAQNEVEDQKFVYRVRQNGTKYNEFGSLQNILGSEVFEKFAADSEKFRSLESRIDAIKNLPGTLIIFGDRDVRISLDNAEAFLSKSRRGVQVIKIAGMDHQFENDDQRRIIYDRIDEFFLK